MRESKHERIAQLVSRALPPPRFFAWAYLASHPASSPVLLASASSLFSSCARPPRTQAEMVYTYVGDIVISVNPFKNTGCTGSAIRSKYKGGQRSHLPPHIYALVDQTYSTMVRDGNSQSILISGESGAGKTEAMKICLTFIGQVSQAKGERVASEVAPRLMMTNPVMEGLGAHCQMHSVRARLSPTAAEPAAVAGPSAGAAAEPAAAGAA